MGDAIHEAELPKLARMCTDDAQMKRLLPLVKRQEEQLVKCWSEMVRCSMKLEDKVDSHEYESMKKNFQKEVELRIENHTVSQDQRYLDSIESRLKRDEFRETIRNYVKVSAF